MITNESDLAPIVVWQATMNELLCEATPVLASVADPAGGAPRIADGLVAFDPVLGHYIFVESGGSSFVIPWQTALCFTDFEIFLRSKSVLWTDPSFDFDVVLPVRLPIFSEFSAEGAAIYQPTTVRIISWNTTQ